MKEQYNRLDKVAKLHFGSMSNLAKSMDLPTQTFYTYKDKDFGELMLKRFQQVGINPNFIRNGELPMITEIYYETDNPLIIKEPVINYDYDYKANLNKLLLALEHGELTIKRMEELEEILVQILSHVQTMIKAQNKITKQSE